MSGKKKVTRKTNRDNRKVLLIAALAVIVVAVVIIVWFLINRGISGGGKVEYGVPVDYEAKGYIELGEYKGIPVSVEVTDEDVEEEIQSILEDEEVYEQETGKAKNGDMVNIDYTCELDGKVIEDWSGQDEYTTLGDEDYFPEFDTGIAGMNTGETKDITVDVPEDYGDELIDGKTVQFNVTLNYICGDEIEQELNDDFVKEYSDGECQKVKDFNDYIKESLYNDNVENLPDTVWEEVLSNTKVKKYHKGELDNSVKETEQSYENFAEFSGSSIEEILESFGMTEDDMKDIAKDMALEKMAAKTIAAKENITLSDDEYRNLLVEYMEYENNEDQSMTLEEIEADYQESFEENPKDAMIRENVKKYIKNWAQITGLK